MSGLLKNTRCILMLIFVFSFVAVKVGFSQGSFKTSQQNNRTSVFRPGDGVYINTYPDTSSFLNGVFPIDGSGNIELPVSGKVNLTGMSVKGFTDYLKSTFAPYLRSTNIYVKPVIRISLLGGFVRPGFYYVDSDATLWEIIRRAGGTLREDGVEKMVWQRGDDEKSDHLAPILMKGLSLKQIGFRSGDLIWTPSPDARTFWDVVRDVMPIVSLATTMVVTYYTIRQQELLLLYGRRY